MAGLGSDPLPDSGNPNTYASDPKGAVSIDPGCPADSATPALPMGTGLDWVGLDLTLWARGDPKVEPRGIQKGSRK